MTMGKESFFLAAFLQSASYFRSRRGRRMENGAPYSLLQSIASFDYYGDLIAFCCVYADDFSNYSLLHQVHDHCPVELP